MSRPVLSAAICLALAVAGSMTGCATSARELPSPDTVSVDTLEAQAKDIYRSISGFDVQIDCGSSTVDFSVGTEVSCVGTEAGDSEEIPLRVQITAIEGENFVVSVRSAWPAGP